MAGKATPKITIEGQSISPIARLSLRQDAGKHHKFTIGCPFSELPNSIQGVGQNYVGKSITIQLLAGLDEGRGQMSFEGVVTKVRLSKSEAAVMQLMIEGHCPTILLDDGPHHRTFTDKSLADIIKTVANDFPQLQTKIDPAYTAPIPYVTQYGESAFGFLNRLLATYGEWGYYDGESAVYGRPPHEEEIELVFGHDMIGLEVTALVAPPNFKLVGYNYLGDSHYDSSGAQATVPGIGDLTQELMGTATEVFAHEPTLAEPLDAVDKATLDKYAERRRAAVAGSFLQLAGISTRLDLRLGQVIKVRALASTMSFGADEADYGSFRIISLSHDCNAQGDYHNNFKAIPAKLEIPPIEFEQIRLPRAEAQLAEVLENDDPEQLGRVQVQFPWQKPDDERTPWLRVSAAGAGSGHGAYFVPEIGDQVLVDFTHNNPDRPVVTGSLYHGKVKPADAHDPDNNAKIIRTRSGNQVVFSDKDGEESIKIENGTNVLTLSLKGDHTIDITTAGDMTLSGKNITIAAEEELVLTAGKNAMYESGQATSITAGSGCTVDGGPSVEVTAQNVDLEAQVGLVAKGGATTDVQAPSTTVKGDAIVSVESPMVKLN